MGLNQRTRCPHPGSNKHHFFPRDERGDRVAEAKRKAVYKEPGPKAKKPKVVAPASSSSSFSSSSSASASSPRRPSVGIVPVASAPKGLYDDDPLSGAEGKRRGRLAGSKKGLRMRTASGEVLLDTARSMRGSTVSRSAEAEVARRRAGAAAERRAAKAASRAEVKFKFTQEELLVESVATERDNSKWLLTAQRLSRSKEASAKGPGRAGAAQLRATSSRACPWTVTFSEVDAMPPFFRHEPLPPTPALHGSTCGGECAAGGAAGGGAVGRGICAVTFGAARYFDPLTRKPYANAAAFRALRAGAGLPKKPCRKL